MDLSEQKMIGILPPAGAAAEAGRPCCVECRTTATPMWRGGPTGPRSLCNACGIRYRKKRRQELGLDNKKPQQQRPQQPQPQQHQDHSEATSAVKDSSSSSNKSSNLQVVKKRRVLMGVEEAAILLMALSSSSRSTLLHG
uniref:GATA-type domain-containing protein n=1 Tax=Arundo donax TaxID=35708 RepID=A0A0A9CDY1_ARUDO